jgi:Bax protein
MADTDGDNQARGEDEARANDPDLSRPRGDDDRPTLMDLAVIAVAALLVLAFIIPRESTYEPLPDFAGLGTQDRKTHFLEYLEPRIRAVNARAREDHAFIEDYAASLHAGDPLSLFQTARLESLAERYEVSLTDGIESALETLLLRTGTVPASLALIQAAKESGWGTSRFAQTANNLFGQRCYVSRRCGVMPARRSAGDTGWGIARFNSAYASLRSYLLNLNTHPAYDAFRRERARLRSAGEPLSGIALAATLGTYSQRGEAYVQEIRSMIRQNGLE